MAAADVSGVLALMQDYFTNTLQTTPSPALLKAMLINGARPTGDYNLQVNNAINYEGWGLVNLPNSLPPGITPTASYRPADSIFIWTKARPTRWPPATATPIIVTLHQRDAQYLPLRVTLAWTDPPGDPAAAIKLVNNLELVVTNLDNRRTDRLLRQRHSGGQRLQHAGKRHQPRRTWTPSTTLKMSILPPHAGHELSPSRSSGARVNVNAVTAQTNNAAEFMRRTSCRITRW